MNQQPQMVTSQPVQSNVGQPGLIQTIPSQQQPNYQQQQTVPQSINTQTMVK